MKRLLLFCAFALPLLLPAQVITGGMTPRVIEGSTSTNNNRVVCWFWLTINGLTPNTTYHYFTALDTLNASTTSNGAGIAMVVNKDSRVIRRISNSSMSSSAGYDSLTSDALGSYSGWFGVEPTGNGRFAPGNLVYPKIMLNNGAGGTSVASRVLAATMPIKVLNFGTTASSATQGSALYDSLDAAPKNFIGIYDNIAASGSPLNIAIVESDSVLNQTSSMAAFYRNLVDTLPMHWGAIIPNDNPNGVRALVEYDFTTGTAVDTVTDDDGVWCSGTNTVNMTNGNTGLYLNSTFVLSTSAMMPDTAWTGIPETFTAMSNDTNSTFNWNFGDLDTASGATTSHSYLAPGVYNASVIISNGGCSDTISQTVVVELTTGIFAPMPLSFNLFPNPTDGEFTITTKDNNMKIVTVYNTLGETVYSQEINGNSFRMNLGGLEKGIYLVRVQDKTTGKSGTKRIVLQ